MTGPRTHFKRSLSADYFTEKELTGLIGCTPDKWHITILKELIDNSLDAAEQMQDHPVIEITVDDAGTLTVQDNGPGLPAHVVDGSLDFEFFISDKNGRVAPSRGQLGNALKCLFAVPLVTDGETHIEIISQGLHHDIRLVFDQLTGKPDVARETKQADVQNECFFKIHGFLKSRFQEAENGKKWLKDTSKIETLINDFSIVNPHVNFHLNIMGQTFFTRSASKSLNIWAADKPLVTHWHDSSQLRNLLQMTFNNQGNIPVNKFLSQFNGLKQSGKQKAVCDATGINSIDGIQTALESDAVLNSLLLNMKAYSRPVKPNALGGLHTDHVIVAWGGEKIQHRKASGHTSEDRPFILDVFFQEMEPEALFFIKDNLTIGLNNSVLIDGSIQHLNKTLDDIMVDYFDPVRILVHVVTPYVEFHSKGKNSMVLDDKIFEALNKKLVSAAKEWTRGKKRRLRGEKVAIAVKKPTKKEFLPMPSDKEGMKEFADTLQAIQDKRDFKTGVRGWCYILEDEIGLPKSEFDKASSRIGDCRKTGLLPPDFTAEDEKRRMICGDHDIDNRSPDQFLDDLMSTFQKKYLEYHPVNLHSFLDTAIIVAVEKSDLIERAI